MAIHDVDKKNNNRVMPMPNVKDVNSNRLAHGTIGFTLKGEDSDASLGKLIIKDGRLLLQTDGNTFIDLSNGNLEVKRRDGNVMARIGYRPDDQEGAVQVAKTTTNL